MLATSPPYSSINRIPYVDDKTHSIALGDVDGDGDLDAYIGNQAEYGIENFLYLNDGTGFFTDAANQIPVDFGRTFSAALVDVDSDGDLDAFLGNHYGQNRLFLNDGSGLFDGGEQQIPIDRTEASSVAFGDVDGDGDLDAMVGNNDAQNNLLL